MCREKLLGPNWFNHPSLHSQILAGTTSTGTDDAFYGEATWTGGVKVLLDQLKE